MINLLLSDIERAREAKLHSVVLVAILALPDICGAVEYGERKPVRDRYIKWLETYGIWMWGDKDELREMFGPQDVYALRCKVLHLGQVGREEDRPPLAISVPDEHGHHVLWPEPQELRDDQFVVPLPGFTVQMLKTVRFWQERTGGQSNGDLSLGGQGERDH